MNSSTQRSAVPFDDSLVTKFQSSMRERLGLDLRPCQILAAKRLCLGSIAELPTGEGKTVATALAACLHANSNRKVLVVTANDYLAARDAQWMAEMYADLAVSVGVVTNESTLTERREAYRADVTYGTLREFAFDYLKRAIGSRQSDPSAQDLAYGFDSLIIDEADSVLIDEARTPLIITAATGSISPASEACYQWSAAFVQDFDAGIDFVYLQEIDAIALTDAGRRRVFLAKMPEAMKPLTSTEIQHGVERALWVNSKILRDVHYIVDGLHLKLIDEYTGRSFTQRSFGGGIQQAVQAREGIPLTLESQPAAKITIQDFVSKFKCVSGITATAWEDRRELASVYDLAVQRIEPHLPSRRVDYPPCVSCSREEKYERIASETLTRIGKGRAVLVATRTIDQSARLSEHFLAAGIEHNVLSARNPAAEATIIAKAGQTDPKSGHGRVTIATNMAGRGTDIQLDQRVIEAGGLHVIVSEPHAASRIDRQLFGRSGRQGDLGTAQLFCSPDDDILVEAFGIDRVTSIRQAAAKGASDRWLVAQLTRAQRHVARRHRIERARLSAHEAAMNESLIALGFDPHLDPLPSNF